MPHYEPEDFDPPSPRDQGWVREDEIPDLTACEKFLKGILEAVFETGNIAKLEDFLDELCGQFGIPMVAKQSVLTRREKQENDAAKEIFALGLAMSRAQAEQLLPARRIS
jgi:hypothetical protein